MLGRLNSFIKTKIGRKQVDNKVEEDDQEKN